jgi:hypothetical protein
MVVIYWCVMLQGSRMILVCVGDEEKVVGLHLMTQEMNEMVVIHQYVMLPGSQFYVAGEQDEAGMSGWGGEGGRAPPHEMNVMELML